MGTETSGHKDEPTQHPKSREFARSRRRHVGGYTVLKLSLNLRPALDFGLALQSVPDWDAYKSKSPDKMGRLSDLGPGVCDIPIPFIGIGPWTPLPSFWYGSTTPAVRVMVRVRHRKALGFTDLRTGVRLEGR